MRYVAGSMWPEMQKVYSQSTFLIKMVTNAPATFYMSTGGAVTWNAQNWLTSGARMIYPVTPLNAGFSMPNLDGGILAQAAAGDLKRAVVEIYVLYPDADEAVLVMKGVVASVSGLFSDRAQFKVDRYSDENMMVPTVLIAPPTFSILPPRYLRIEWGGKILHLRNK